MGKKTSLRERISQKSISFPQRVFAFLEKYPDFKIHTFCQKAVDDQIAYQDPTFLNEEDSRYKDD